MAIQWNRNQIFEHLPMLRLQLESIQSAIENESSLERMNDLMQNINEHLATYLTLKDRVTATFEKTQNQIIGANGEDLEKISENLSNCTCIIDSINYKISIAQSLISKNPSSNQNNSEEALRNQERKIVAIQDEDYQIGQFKDTFTQFSSNTLESNPHELFGKLIDFCKELKKYSLNKTGYFKAENNETVTSLLKQTTEWMQNIISQQEKIEMEQKSEQEKIEKEQKEKESYLAPLEKLQCALALQDTNKTSAVDDAFKELESEDKKKLLVELNKILLENKTTKRELQPSILGQSFSMWPGTYVQKVAAIEKILPPAKESTPPSAKPIIEIQFLAEKMTDQMNEALEGQTNNDNSPVIFFEDNNNNQIAPITNNSLRPVSNFTISCHPSLPSGSTLFIRGIEGNWDKGMPLIEIGPNLWKFELKDLDNQECKLLINDDTNFWEKLNGNRKIVNGELISTQGAEFTNIPEGIEEGAAGFFVFVNFGFDENKYKIAICGENIEGTNDWDGENPLFLAKNEGCWSVQIHKRTFSPKPVIFKYMLVSKNGESLIWEKDLTNGPNRTIGDMTEPKF